MKKFGNERLKLLSVLSYQGVSKSEIARIFKVDRMTVYNFIEREHLTINN